MKKYYIKLFLFLALTGCSSGLNYTTLKHHIQNDNCSNALAYIKQNKIEYGDGMKLIYYFDNAMIHMVCGNYEKSNKMFRNAETLAEKLWTKSITKEIASYLINDNTVPYSGEDYEKAMINLISALNYSMLNNIDEALVEIRRLDSVLSLYNQKYKTKNVYKEDAFGRYFSGILYESSNEFEDAYIDYLKAFKIYRDDYLKNYGVPIPRSLAKDILRIAEETDRLPEIEHEIKKMFNKIEWKKLNDTRKKGKIVYIHLNGTSPVKVEDKTVIPSPQGPITMALPRYVVYTPYCQKNSFIVINSKNEEKRIVSELVEDINGIAVKNLDDRKVRIIAKALARLVAKQVAINAITKNKNIKFMLNVLNSFIETADTRSFRTLPGEIYLAHLYVTPGEHKIYSKMCGNNKKFVKTVNVKAGETKFISNQTMF